MKIINSMNNISGAVQRASIIPNQRPPGAPTNPTVSTPNPTVGSTSRPVIGQPNPATVPPANTLTPNPNFPEFKVINNISKRINDTNPPKYVLSQLNAVVDKLKNKEKYARVGAKFTKVIAFYGWTSECYIVNYASAIAGELGHEYIEASGMVLEANVTRIVKFFEEARKSNKPTVVLITNANMIGNQQAKVNLNNASRDAEIALQVELASDKNSNLTIILQTTGTYLRVFYDLTNGMAVNFNYPTFGDGGTLDDRENFIKQILIKKNIPFDFDLDLRDFADRAIGLSRISIERSIQRAAEKMTVLGHTKITLDVFDLAAEEIIYPTIEHPIFSEERQEKTAIHEAGHTLLAYLNGEKFLYVTILSDNRGSSGKMYYAFNCDILNISEMKNRLCTYLGGRAAEELYGNGVREGIGTDIKLANDLAKRLVLIMTSENQITGRNIEMNICSEKKKQEYDNNIDDIIAKAYSKAKKMLADNENKHKLIVEALMKFKRLSKAEIDVLLKNDCAEDLIQFKKEKLQIALSPVRTKQVCDMEKA